LDQLRRIVQIPAPSDPAYALYLWVYSYEHPFWSK
jgi:hypothetical protein